MGIMEFYADKENCKHIQLEPRNDVNFVQSKVHFLRWLFSGLRCCSNGSVNPGGYTSVVSVAILRWQLAEPTNS